MRKLLLAFATALALAAVAAVPLARADHDSDGILPAEPTAVVSRAVQRGFVTYALDAGTAAYPNFRAQAAQVALAGLQAEGLHIPAYEVTAAGQPDIWLTMPADQTFITACSAGAAGCILYANDPVVVYFRRALLYSDWKSTIGHEGINYGHAFGEHEQYYDITFTCKSLADLNSVPNGMGIIPGPTVMSCGTGIWEPQPFDVAIIRKVVVPVGVNGTNLDTSGSFGRLVLWYGPSRSPFAQATRTAVFIQTVGFPLIWLDLPSEHWGPISTTSIQGVAVPYYGNTSYYVGAENALPTSWGNLQYVGTTPR